MEVTVPKWGLIRKYLKLYLVDLTNLPKFFFWNIVEKRLHWASIVHDGAGKSHSMNGELLRGDFTYVFVFVLSAQLHCYTHKLDS